MEVDEYSADDQMEVDQQGEDIYSMIKSCKFNMKMKMIESARKQVNVLSDSFQFCENTYEVQLEKPVRWSWAPFSQGGPFIFLTLLSRTFWKLKKVSSPVKENKWINVNYKFDDNLSLLEMCLNAPLIHRWFLTL